MKLSEIKGERAFDVVADLIEPISKLAEDDDVIKMLANLQGEEGNTLDNIKSLVPALLKSHKSEIVAIMAILHGVSETEYLEGVNLASLVSDVVDMLSDDELLAFLS